MEIEVCEECPSVCVVHDGEKDDLVETWSLAL